MAVPGAALWNGSSERLRAASVFWATDCRTWRFLIRVSWGSLWGPPRNANEGMPGRPKNLPLLLLRWVSRDRQAFETADVKKGMPADVVRVDGFDGHPARLPSACRPAADDSSRRE